MRALLLSTAALAWLAACGPRSNANNVGAAGNETGMTGDTAAVAPGATTGVDTTGMGGASDSTSTAAILTTLSTANSQEIREGQLAQQRAQHASVRQFGRRLEHDHQANLEQERQLAEQLGVSQQLPGDTGVAGPTKAVPAALDKRGAAFDTAFVRYEIDAHRTNIDRIQNQMIPAVQDRQVKQYLQQTVTAMQGHLQQAQQIQEQLGGGDSTGTDSAAMGRDSTNP
jgi:putative membrane protein